jgi:hypothetical protein
MSRALLLLLVWSAAPDAPLKPALVPQHSAAGTKCSACHVTASWSEVRFNHDKTGFPLRGQHARVDCRSCHAADFKTPIARQCAACHFDAHAGDLGSRCEGCHDENSWASQYDADAHRRTAFPLIGAHSVIPCQECHSQSRERKFDRSVVECSACHASDVMRTLGTSLDHQSFGFAEQPCQTCHNPMSWKPARYPEHDRCFIVSSGTHSVYTCEQCHTVLPKALTNCATNTAVCTACHEHKCGSPRITAQHPNPAELHFVCADNQCVGCHIGERRP